MQGMEEWKKLRGNQCWQVNYRFVQRKIKMIKTLYNQEQNKIMRSKKSGERTNNLFEPKLVWFDILWWFLCNSLFYVANCFITVGILDAPSWFLFLIQFLTQTDLFLLPFPTKLLFHSIGMQQLHWHPHALLLRTPFYFILTSSELACELRLEFMMLEF
jgi:hypothetical protein